MSKKLTDKAEFVELVYSNMSIIYKICTLYADREDREDLKQEIIYQLWKSYPAFRGESKFQSWMYRVALNTAMLGLRARKVKYFRLDEKEFEIADDPQDHTEKESRISLMYKQIAELKDLDKTIVFLHLEQCSYEEISEITGISVKNVSVRLVRIRARLRKKLNLQYSGS